MPHRPHRQGWKQHLGLLPGMCSLQPHSWQEEIVIWCYTSTLSAWGAELCWKELCSLTWCWLFVSSEECLSGTARPPSPDLLKASLGLSMVMGSVETAWAGRQGPNTAQPSPCRCLSTCGPCCLCEEKIKIRLLAWRHQHFINSWSYWYSCTGLNLWTRLRELTFILVGSILWSLLHVFRYEPGVIQTWFAQC